MSGPDQARALFEAALDFQGRGDWVRAESLYRQALALEPDRAPILANLAALLVGLKRYDDARACCERLAAVQPGDAAAHLNLGNCHMFLASPAAALASYERALAVEPGNIEAAYGRGNALLDLERPQEARQAYRRLLSARPDFARMLHHRGGTLLEAGRAEAALLCHECSLGIGTPLRDGKPPAKPLIVGIAREPRDCFEFEPLSAAAKKGLRLEVMAVDGTAESAALLSRYGVAPLVAKLRDASVLGLSFLPVTRDRKTCLNGFVFNPTRANKIRLFEDAATIPITGPRAVLAYPEGTDDYVEGVLVGSHDNFGHWLFNHLARLALVADLPRFDGVPLVVGENIGPKQVECLDLMGFDETRLIRLRKGRLARFGTLWAPMMPFCSFNDILYWIPGVVDFLRRRLSISDAPAPGSARRRLYVTRNTARWRRVLNEDEIVGALAGRGFEVVEPGLLSIRQQRELAAGAEIIVGAFGAGMNLLLFAPRDAAVIELKPLPDINMNINPPLARRIGQRYAEIVGTPSLAAGVVPHDLDFTIDAGRLLETLDGLGLRN